MLLFSALALQEAFPLQWILFYLAKKNACLKQKIQIVDFHLCAAGQDYQA